MTLTEFWRGAHLLGFAKVHEDRGHLLAKAAAVFEEIDTDGNNKADHEELAQIALKLGVMESNLDSVVAALMDVLDEDGDGTVSRDEFLLAVQRGHLDTLLQTAEAQSQSTFATYDASGDAGSASQHRRHALARSVSDDDDLFAASRGAVARSSRKAPERTEKTQHIPEDKYLHLWDVFCVADDDCSGEINEDELFDLLNDESIFGQKRISRNLISEVMKSIDAEFVKHTSRERSRERERESVCVCVCVFEVERERERDRERVCMCV